MNRQPAAEREHADQPERRYRGERGVVPGGEPDHPQPGAEQVLARGLHPLHLLLFLAEPLDDADPADGLVDDGGDLADLLLRVPAGREELLARRRRDQPERGRDRDRDQGERRRQDDHDDEREHEQEQAAQGQRHPLEQALHHVEVGDRPADELAGVDLVLPRSVQPGQRVEQLGPHGVLHVERHLPAAEPAHVDADEVGDGRDQQADRQRPDRLLRRDDHVVDDRPLQQRDRQRRSHVEQRSRKRDHHVTPESPAVPRQPPDPAGLAAPLAVFVVHPSPLRDALLTQDFQHVSC